LLADCLNISTTTEWQFLHMPIQEPSDGKNRMPEELKVNIGDAVQLMLASIYEEAHEKKMGIEVSL
jgi:hypothetical protein